MNLVKIIYKSGAEVQVVCDEFVVKKSASGLKSIEWSDDAKPRPLFAGIDEIAAVWDCGKVDDDEGLDPIT